jgi:hypothetical protein
MSRTLYVVLVSVILAVALAFAFLVREEIRSTPLYDSWRD